MGRFITCVTELNDSRLMYLPHVVSYNCYELERETRGQQPLST